MSILTSVTEIEDRVVETIKSLQEPVVDVVRRGVERVEGRFPKLTIPAGLPKASDVVDSQFGFAKDLLETQRSFVNELVGAVAPLTRTADDEDDAEAPADPAPKADKPAVKTTKKAAPKS